MGQEFYWVNTKHKIYIYLGRSIKYDEEDLKKIDDFILDLDPYLDDDLYGDLHGAFEEKKIHELTLKNIFDITTVLKKYQNICYISRAAFAVCFFNKYIGEGKIFGSDSDDFDKIIKGFKEISID